MVAAIEHTFERRADSMMDYKDYEAIISDRDYWLDKTCDELEVVDLAGCSGEQLAPRALYLRSLPRPSCSSSRSGDSPVRHLRIVR